MVEIKGQATDWSVFCYFCPCKLPVKSLGLECQIKVLISMPLFFSLKQEIKQLEDKLIKSQLLVRHLEEAVKTLTMKSDDETDTESSSSLDEGTQLARESFEVGVEPHHTDWGETRV